MFSILWKTTLTFWVTCNLSSANAFNLGKPKMFSSGKGLTRNLEPWVQAALDPLGILWECPWKRHFRAPTYHWWNAVLKDTNNVSCCCDMTEIFVESCEKHHSINQYNFPMISILPKLFSSFYTQSWLLTTLKQKHNKSIVVSKENAVNQHFLLFPQYRLPFHKHLLGFESHSLFCLQIMF